MRPGSHRYQSVGRDVTEQKRAEDALRESEASLASIFRAAPVGIGLVADPVLMRVNDRICEMTGYFPEEAGGKNSRILYPTDEEYEYVGSVKYALIQERGTGTVETRWMRKDGIIRDILLSSTPLDPATIRAGVMFTALDITDRKNAETRLQEACRQLTGTEEILREKYAELEMQKKHLKEPTGSSTSSPASPVTISLTRFLSCWEYLNTQKQCPGIRLWREALQNWNLRRWR